MSPNGARKAASSIYDQSRFPGHSTVTRPSFISNEQYEKFFTERERTVPCTFIPKKQYLKQSNPGNWRENDVTDVNPEKDASAPESPLINQLDDKTLAAFPTGRPMEDKADLVQCKHCKRPVSRIASAAHIKECLTKKTEKLRKKKEAKEAKDAAARKEKDEKDDDEGSQSKGARKSAVKGANTDSAKKGKKRKADGDGDKQPNAKKKKKDEPKPKAGKPKGPVDVERQCGVALPNGGQCARSLTCKSHSMGLKRAVPGRSLPYDVLLQQYQKKNQAKQQRAAIEANAPLVDDLDAEGGPIDSDEEKEAIMAAIARSNPQPMATRVPIALNRKYGYIRMKDMFRTSFTPARMGRVDNNNNNNNNTNNNNTNNANMGSNTGPTPIDTTVASNNHGGGMLNSAALTSAGLDSNFGNFSPIMNGGDVHERRRVPDGQFHGGPRSIMPGQLPGPASRKPSLTAGGA
ncbi:SCA7-domain-containing protein [Pseudovirgaria hyperparasitica]|uniref:SCA7-domain-containing protein n=1 Tax=Pseudovirgaria hyperparasitica TaxID=470096 RepID=A0A6A6WMM4_9PEZI|nr:SCA7-domain-containing protein [Pseudovirgaria hyperparasitica]KAF2763455.1 SCA7-domain-containing protein [Pseudovirgaria hyperparasitica]